MVRSLTLAGLAVKRSLEDAPVTVDPGHSSPRQGKRKAAVSAADLLGSKRRREDSPDRDDYTLPVCGLFLAPPEARTSLQPDHIQDAFARMQGDWSHHRSAGMTNWRGGLVRTRVSLI